MIVVTPDLIEDDAPDAALDETIESLEAEQPVTDTPPIPNESTEHRVSAEIPATNGDSDPFTSSEDSAEEPEIAEVELSDEDFVDDELFSGVEDTSEENETGDADDPDDAGFDSEIPAGSLQETINDGASRLAVVGLDEGSEKDDLQNEMCDVFEAFRLGTYGSQFADEYLFVDEEEVDPAWALLGSAIACAGVALMMRPDSAEQAEKMKSAVSGLTGDRAGRSSRFESGVLA